MFILIPNNFFIPVKYIDKNLLNLYGKKLSLSDKDNQHMNKSKKSKKNKCRDSIIDYFSDAEGNYLDSNDSGIFTEIDDEYVLESVSNENKNKDKDLLENIVDKDKEILENTGDKDKKILEDTISNNEYEDLFLELNNNDVEEV